MQIEELVKRRDEAFAKRKAGDYAAALEEFKVLETVSEHPQDIAALRFFQATLLTDMGRIHEALDSMAKVDRAMLGPIDRIDYEFEAARLKRVEGKPREALDQAEGALRATYVLAREYDISGLANNLQTLIGVLLAENGRCEEAIPILEKVSAEEAGWAEARIRLGDCNINNENYQEAINSYSSVASSVTNVHPVHRKTAIRNIGCAYYYMGNYSKAVEYLKKVEHDYDENPTLKAELFSILSAAYSRLGMSHEAVKYQSFSPGSNLDQ